jgi:GAF domain-containing protein
MQRRSLSTEWCRRPGAPEAVQGLACPLLARGATVGVLGMMFERPRPLDDVSTITLVEDLCGRAAIAVDNCLLYREIQDRDVRKDQFLAMLAHELRNPLGVISSALGVERSVIVRIPATSAGRHRAPAAEPHAAHR